MSLQDQIQVLLEKAGIPARRIHVYGSQIMITCIARDTAQEWCGLLHKFASKVRVGEGLDDTADAKKYPNERRNHVVKVYRVWATI